MPPSVLTVIFKDAEGKEIATMLVQTKQFKTGSRGLYGQAKIELDGARYQTQVQMVEIGSKGKTEEEPVAGTA